MLLEQDLDKMNFSKCSRLRRAQTLDEIQKNYLRLVKEFHPDTLRVKEAGSYRRKLEKIFGKVQEAYQEIHPDNKRATYLHELMEGRRTKKDGDSKSKNKYEYKVPKKDVSPSLRMPTPNLKWAAKRKKGKSAGCDELYQMALNLNPTRKAFEDAYHRVRKLMREGF
ncbi:MAG: DnaJ domain-containing protein [Bdellovibrionota bacterium]